MEFLMFPHTHRQVHDCVSSHACLGYLLRVETDWGLSIGRWGEHLSDSGLDYRPTALRTRPSDRSLGANIK